MILGMLFCLSCAAAASGAASVPAEDLFYEALHGEPVPVEAGLLLSAPGRFVGRAVTTRGRLARTEGSPSAFELALGPGAVLLRLEPAAAGMVATTGAEGRSVEVVGLFYREASGSAQDRYALRAWRVQPTGEGARPPHARTADALALTLEQLVYGAGRYDGRLVRVRGRYRGSNVHRDLPPATRKGARDWVLKDGPFAVWVADRGARGEGWDLAHGAADADATLEVTGVPSFAKGVVRLAAREVAISPVPLATADVGARVALPPRVSFAYPIPGQPLRRRGLMIIEFSKSMEAARFEGAVRVRYERAGAVTGVPRVGLEYHDRDRALVVAPDPPPPPDTDVVVDLLEGIIDKDGRGLVPREAIPDGGAKRPAGVPVDQVRFRSGR
jgi:hypothetical protein